MRIHRTTGIGALLLTLSACASTGVNPRKEASERRSVRFEGMNVAYASRGRGEPALVFVHGWSCDRSFWEAQMASPTLARGRRLLAVDLPGHGESDKPAIHYTMDLFARAIASALDDAGVRRAVLVGHSMGTPVIRQFYRLHPSRTAGLVMVDGPLQPFLDNSASWEEFLAPLRGADYREWAGKFVEARLDPATDPAERDHVRRVILATPQHVMIGSMEAFSDPAIWKEDPIEVPVLMVMAKGPFATPEFEAFLKRLAPRADYRVMEGVSHFLMMDRPTEFNDMVGDWLARNGL